MTDKEEELISEALKYALIFILVVSAPVWVPFLLFGAFFFLPFFLIYMLVDEIAQDKKEKEEKQN